MHSSIGNSEGRSQTSFWIIEDAFHVGPRTSICVSAQSLASASLLLAIASMRGLLALAATRRFCWASSTARSALSQDPSGLSCYPRDPDPRLRPSVHFWLDLPHVVVDNDAR